MALGHAKTVIWILFLVQTWYTWRTPFSVNTLPRHRKRKPAFVWIKHSSSVLQNWFPVGSLLLEIRFLAFELSIYHLATNVCPLVTQSHCFAFDYIGMTFGETLKLMNMNGYCLWKSSFCRQQQALSWPHRRALVNKNSHLHAGLPGFDPNGALTLCLSIKVVRNTPQAMADNLLGENARYFVVPTYFDMI